MGFVGSFGLYLINVNVNGYHFELYEDPTWIIAELYIRL
jgi:hypothetical protein